MTGDVIGANSRSVSDTTFAIRHRTFECRLLAARRTPATPADHGGEQGEDGGRHGIGKTDLHEYVHPAPLSTPAALGFVRLVQFVDKLPQLLTLPAG